MQCTLSPLLPVNAAQSRPKAVTMLLKCPPWNYTGALHRLYMYVGQQSKRALASR